MYLAARVRQRTGPRGPLAHAGRGQHGRDSDFRRDSRGVHAIAHPVGAHFNTHHGLTNAVLMPYVVVHNRPAIDKSHLPVIARTLEPATVSPTAAVFDWILGFRQRP